MLHYILRKCLHFPYKFQCFKALNRIDKRRRLEFADHCSTQLEGYSASLSKLVLFDECMFRINCVIINKLVSIRAVERPDEHNLVFINRPHVMTCCAILKGRVIGPYISGIGNRKGEFYRFVLIHYGFQRFKFLQELYILSSTVLPCTIHTELQLI